MYGEIADLLPGALATASWLQQMATNLLWKAAIKDSVRALQKNGAWDVDLLVSLITACILPDSLETAGIAIPAFGFKKEDRSFA